MCTCAENVEKYVHKFTSICMALDQLNILPGDDITGIIKGLLMANHLAFGRLFVNFYQTQIILCWDFS